MNVYEGITQGLEEAIEYNKGNLKARSKTISIAPLPDFNAAEIKTIRTNLGMTQILFANLIGVSKKTVEAWEAGKNSPNGAATRMLSLIKADPDLPQKMKIISQ